MNSTKGDSTPTNTKDLKELLLDHFVNSMPVEVDRDYASVLLDRVLQQAVNKARIEAVLKIAEQLDRANVPQEVKVPELIGDEPHMVSVPIVSGDHWQAVHRALKNLREYTVRELKTPNQEGDTK
jgi:hypothetical protein